MCVASILVAVVLFLMWQHSRLVCLDSLERLQLYALARSAVSVQSVCVWRCYPCPQSSEGAHLSWEPPANNAGTITEYSVYLGLKPAPGTVPGTMAFARVYCGPGSSCVVSHNQLASAHIDTTSKPAIIFRIAAKNDKGYTPHLT